MTTPIIRCILTIRCIKGDFIVASPDIRPARFNSRREAKDWCLKHYRGSPIYEVGADASKRLVTAPKGRRPKERTRPVAAYL